MKRKMTTSQLSTNKGSDPKTIKPVDKTEEISTPDAEAINPDSTEEAMPDTETTATGMANTATFAKFRGTDKRNAERG